MIDKITAKIRRYPFQTGIAAGILICLICAGFFSLFQDHGKTLAGNDEIIQQDYLRMTINEYSRNNDELLADWRYKHLGSKAGETLKLMTVDETIPAQQVVSFAKAIGHADKLGGTNDNNSAAAGTPANPRKGLSGFGKVLLILLGLVIVAAGGLYAASLIKTKNRQKRRSDVNPLMDNEPINMITPEKAQAQQKAEAEPDTLFDLDSLFPQGGEQANAEGADTNSDSNESAIKNETESDVEFDSSGILFQELNIGVDDDEKQEQALEEEEPAAEIIIEERNELPEEKAGDQIDLTETKEADEIIDDGSEMLFDEKIIQPGLDFEKSVHMIDGSEPEPESVDDASNDDVTETADQNNSTEISVNDMDDKDLFEETVIKEDSEDSDKTPADEILDPDAEKPLIETDPGSDPENEDELLKLIRNSTSAQNEEDIPEVSEKAVAPEEPDHDQNITDGVETASPDEDEAEMQEKDEKSQESTDDILIHYQSVYRIGNDMYDEVFSIDQGDNFRGECGISIGETLNNTEPKAVTAFEVWLFDKDDIHTATWYLMSDFALDNEGISKRLEQRGKCDRIRKHDIYVLETETLIVEIKVLELEYGTEMEEKNSYFTNVVFDVIARQKPANENAN